MKERKKLKRREARGESREITRGEKEVERVKAPKER